MANPLIITILGSGTCVPSLKRSSCSVLVETGPWKLLFDTGPGTMRRLLEAGRTIHDLTHVFYSHFHPDHTAELVPLLFATKYPDPRRRRQPLTICAAGGFQSFFDGLKKVYGRWIELEPGWLNIIELETKGVDFLSFDNFSVKSIPVRHSPESLAFRVSGQESVSVVYSGDTDFSENLVSLAKDAQILICESSYPDALKVDGHLSPSVAGRIAFLAGARKLVLTHLYPECEEVDLVAECRKSYDGPVIVAEDLMRIELTG